MTKPVLKSAVAARSRTTRALPPSRRAVADRALAREAILARETLAARPEKEPRPEAPHWPLLGSMLVH